MSESTDLKKFLAKLGIDNLNEMQQAAIAAAADNKNVLLLSPTGTGKTLAFLLPAIKEMKSKVKGTQALVITPTRELALQIEKVFRMMSTGMKVTTCYGGHFMETEENNLREAPQLLIGTPGRLADHIRRGNISTPTITTLVLDEFDKSLELGFSEDMAFILSELPALNKKILTSATDIEELPEYLDMTGAMRLHFTSDAQQQQQLTLEVLHSKEKDKLPALLGLLCKYGKGQSIVFCNHREAVERVGMFLTEEGIVNERYHGALEQDRRDEALCKFRNGSVNVLVTTDLGSRGLDIPEVQTVIHYHLPHNAEAFTHRNGRTARMTARGRAVLILGPEEHVPEYAGESLHEIVLPANNTLPAPPLWATLFISAGRKDKVNKVDIVGFLAQKGELKKDEIGLIEVKDFHSFVAVKSSKVSGVLSLVRGQKIKNKGVRISLAR